MIHNMMIMQKMRSLQLLKVFLSYLSKKDKGEFPTIINYTRHYRKSNAKINNYCKTTLISLISYYFIVLLISSLASCHCNSTNSDVLHNFSQMIIENAPLTMLQWWTLSKMVMSHIHRKFPIWCYGNMTTNSTLYCLTSIFYYTTLQIILSLRIDLSTLLILEFVSQRFMQTSLRKVLMVTLNNICL